MRNHSILLLVLLALAGTSPQRIAARPTPAADPTLWIDRPAAQPWLPALQAAAARTALPVALIAELIGAESGFQNVHNPNPHSSAYGFGQQLAGNAVMRREHLDRAKPAESILGAAIQFQEALMRSGSLAAAARAYGTTAGLSALRQGIILTRFERAGRGRDLDLLPAAAAVLPASVRLRRPRIHRI